MYLPMPLGDFHLQLREMLHTIANAPGQDRKAVAIAQVSGAGKTKLALSAAISSTAAPIAMQPPVQSIAAIAATPPAPAAGDGVAPMELDSDSAEKVSKHGAGGPAAPAAAALQPLQDQEVGLQAVYADLSGTELNRCSKVVKLVIDICKAIHELLESQMDRSTDESSRYRCFLLETDQCERLLRYLMLCFIRQATLFARTIRSVSAGGLAADVFSEALVRMQVAAQNSLEKEFMPHIFASHWTAALQVDTLATLTDSRLQEAKQVMPAGFYMVHDEVTTLSDFCRGFMVHQCDDARMTVLSSAEAPGESDDPLDADHPPYDPTTMLDDTGAPLAIQARALKRRTEELDTSKLILSSCTDLFYYYRVAISELRTRTIPMVMLDTHFSIWKVLLERQSPARLRIEEWKQLPILTADDCVNFLQQHFQFVITPQQRDQIALFAGRPLYFFKHLLNAICERLKVHPNDANFLTTALNTGKEGALSSVTKNLEKQLSRPAQLLKDDYFSSPRGLLLLCYTTSRLNDGVFSSSLRDIRRLVEYGFMRLPGDGLSAEMSIDLKQEPITWMGMKNKFDSITHPNPEADECFNFLANHMTLLSEQDRTSATKGVFAEQMLAWAILRHKGKLLSSILLDCHAPEFVRQLQFSHADVMRVPAGESPLELLLKGGELTPFSHHILLPDQRMGPDLLLFFPATANNPIAVILCIQCKARGSDSSKTDLVDALFSVNPGFFYLDNRHQFMTKQHQPAAAVRSWFDTPAHRDVRFVRLVFGIRPFPPHVLEHVRFYNGGALDAGATERRGHGLDNPILLAQSSEELFGKKIHNGFLDLCPLKVKSAKRGKQIYAYSFPTNRDRIAIALQYAAPHDHGEIEVSDWRTLATQHAGEAEPEAAATPTSAAAASAAPAQSRKRKDVPDAGMAMGAGVADAANTDAGSAAALAATSPASASYAKKAKTAAAVNARFTLCLSGGSWSDTRHLLLSRHDTLATMLQQAKSVIGTTVQRPLIGGRSQGSAPITSDAMLQDILEQRMRNQTVSNGTVWVTATANSISTFFTITTPPSNNKKLVGDSAAASASSSSSTQPSDASSSPSTHAPSASSSTAAVTPAPSSSSEPPRKKQKSAAGSAAVAALAEPLRSSAPSASSNKKPNQAAHSSSTAAQNSDTHMRDATNAEKSSKKRARDAAADV